MTLHELKISVEKMPTVMDISDEISIIESLMKVDREDILKNKDSFTFILKALHLSHVDSGYMEVTEENKYVFDDFSRWLHGLSLRGIGIHHNIISDFYED